MSAVRSHGTLDPDTLLSCLSNESLHLVILPTESCNFRCVYCYEDFGCGRMEPRVVNGIKRLLTRRAPGLADLTLSWFGGEPLLARDVIEDVMGHVGGLAAANPALRVASDATTNGYHLTSGLADRLLDLGVTRYQISFDGPREVHDRRRVLRGGVGTFDRIWTNLLALRRLSRPFTITIRLHVDRENLEAVPRFIDGCADAFGSDSRFEIFIRGLGRLGGARDADLAVFDETEGEAIYEELRSYARSRGLRTMRPPSERPVCYAARANSYVVRADGRLNKCTVSLEHPNNQVGYIRGDGTFEVDSQKVCRWIRGLGSASPGELKCPMKGLADPARAGGARATPPAVASRPVET
jgi:uncharacterized protein